MSSQAHDLHMNTLNMPHEMIMLKLLLCATSFSWNRESIFFFYPGKNTNTEQTQTRARCGCRALDADWGWAGGDFVCGPTAMETLCSCEDISDQIHSPCITVAVIQARTSHDTPSSTLWGHGVYSELHREHLKHRIFTDALIFPDYESQTLQIQIPILTAADEHSNLIICFS